MSDHDTDDVFEDLDEPTLLDELGAFDEPTRTLSHIHISEPTRPYYISYAGVC